MRNLTAIVLLMLWLYICICILFIGAELNSFLNREHVLEPVSGALSLIWRRILLVQAADNLENNRALHHRRLMR